MNKVTKRMAIIAVIGVFAVIIAASVTFVSAQTDQSSLLAQNIVALAQNENGGGIALMDCYMAFSNQVAPVWYNSCSKAGSGGVYYECGAITNKHPAWGITICSQCYVYMK